jgi:putative hydrolase
MIQRLDLARQDMHVHSIFSDGRNTIEENVVAAEQLGLTDLTCVDHVRRDTDWVPEFAAEVARVRLLTHVRLTCGVEAKLLDTAGHLDLPQLPSGVDRIYAADHQVPLAAGPRSPEEIRGLIEQGELAASEVVASLVAATAAAVVERPEQVVIAHLFSVLPKLGLTEADVPHDLVDSLAAVASRAGALVEIDERWRCPSAATLRAFVRHGVPVLLSTDSHRCETIGHYDYCASVVDELARPGTTPDQGR